MPHVNWFAIVVAAVASMVVGSIWYGPLFGKIFMKEMGMDQWSAEKKAAMMKSMTMSYVGQFIASLVMFYVLAMIMTGMGKSGLSGGLMAGFWVWLGFQVTHAFGNTLWGGKKIMFYLSAGSSFFITLIGAAIIGLWK